MSQATELLDGRRAATQDRSKRFRLSTIVVGLVLACIIGYGLARWFIRSSTQSALKIARKSLLKAETPSALEATAWILRFHPHHAEALHIQGLCRKIDGNLPGAVDSFEKSIATFTSEQQSLKLYEEVCLDLGIALLEERRFDRAESVLKQHLARYPSSDTARDNLKAIYYWQFRSAESLQLLEDRLVLIPGDLSVLPEILVTSITPTANDVANYFEKVNSERPGQSPVVLALGHAFWKIGQFDRAHHYLQEALRLNPDDRRTHLIVADFQLDNDDVEEAGLLISELRTDDNDDYYWSIRSRISERLKEYEQALKFIDRALSITPYEREYLSRKARLLQRLDKNREAEQLHSQVLRLAQAWLKLETLAASSSRKVPSSAYCRQLSELYAIIGKPELSSAWALLQKKAKHVELISKSTSHPIPVDYNEFYLVNGN